MCKKRVCALLAAVGIMAAAGDAFAATVAVNCSSPGALVAQFTGATPGGTENTVYSVSNGPCTGNFTITQDNITVQGVSGTTQTISGRVGISGASNILLQDLIIDGTTAMNPPVAVFIVGPASVTIQPTTGTSTIQKATSDGVRVEGPARVTINTTTITNNGGTGVLATTGAIVLISSGTFSTNANGAVVAQQGSTVTLDAGSITSPSGPNVGPAITALQSSTATVGVNSITGPDAAATILADQNSSISIKTPSSIATSGMATAGPAIVALHSSSISISGGSVTGPSANHTILALQGSTLFLHGSVISSDVAPPFAALVATQASSIEVAGGNDITNLLSGGLAVKISDVAAFHESNGTLFGFTQASDTITGNGIIATQSVIELGASPGSATLTWTGDVKVQQASSFVADGGNVTINGTLTLGQSANGYFNFSAGTSNAITAVKCTSTTDHVSNPTDVTPNVPTGPPPGCQLF